MYARNSLPLWINQYIHERWGTIPGEATILLFLAEKEQLINQEYVEIKPHIKPVQRTRLQWQWFTAGWAKLLTVRSCNACQRLLLISVAGDRYCYCYFLPRRFHWCLPKYPTVLYLNHMGTNGAIKNMLKASQIDHQGRQFWLQISTAIEKMSTVDLKSWDKKRQTYVSDTQLREQNRSGIIIRLRDVASQILACTHR